MSVFSGNMIVFISMWIFYQCSIVLAVYYLFILTIIIIILTQLGIILVKLPRTIIWMGHYIRKKLLLLLHSEARWYKSIHVIAHITQFGPTVT